MTPYYAADIFEIAPKIGMPTMKIVDISGDFPGNSNIYGTKNSPIFQEIASILQLGIHDFRKRFVNNPNIQFIAK